MSRSVLRGCRESLKLSQAAFARRLGVSIETYRTWDSGRRQPPESILRHARQLYAGPRDDEAVPLAVLAPLIGVHVRTLRHAARVGRLRVTYDTRTTFRQVRRLATLRDGEVFLRTFYRQTYSRYCTHAPISWPLVPDDFDVQIRSLRERLYLSQASFAKKLGAACRAVVYQWESRKRVPSPLFWQRICSLQPKTRQAQVVDLHSQR